MGGDYLRACPEIIDCHSQCDCFLSFEDVPFRVRSFFAQFGIKCRDKERILTCHGFVFEIGDMADGKET